MSKALVLADLHIHSHKDRVDRLHHCLEVLDWMFVEAENHKVDYIFFLGDLFHERSKIDMRNYMKTFEVFIKHMVDYKANRDVYLLVGNHDMYHKERWDINSVKPLTAIPRVHIIDQPSRVKLGNCKIDWMPYTDNPIKVLNDFKQIHGNTGDLLLGHAAVHGATLNVCYGTKADVIVEYDCEMFPVDAGVFADWPMTILGHYHGAQKLPYNVEYIGSPLELTYGEAFQCKHLMILDLDTMEKQYIVNNFSPKHLIITPQDVQNETYTLNGNFVRLSVDDLGNKDLIDIKREIITKHKVLSFDTKQKDKKTDEDKAVMEIAKSIFMNTEQMLRTYIKEKSVPAGLDENLLFKAGMKCLEKKI